METALLADDRSGFEPGVAGPRRKLQHGVPATRCEVSDHRLTHSGHRLLDARSLALPARRDRTRDLVDDAAPLLRIHAALVDGRGCHG